MKIETNEYKPGVCNIGKAERAQRRLSGWTGLVVTILVAGALKYFHAAPGWRWLTFFPVMLGTSGFLQSYFHFCINFGLRGVYNFDVHLRRTTRVEQKEYINKDRKKVIRLLLYSALTALVITIIIYAV